MAFMFFLGRILESVPCSDFSGVRYNMDRRSWHRRVLSTSASTSRSLGSYWPSDLAMMVPISLAPMLVGILTAVPGADLPADWIPVPSCSTDLDTFWKALAAKTAGGPSFLSLSRQPSTAATKASLRCLCKFRTP